MNRSLIKLRKVDFILVSPIHEKYLPAESFWISANAGSGKTYNLINRVLQLLISGVLPKKILCITFTNSAADEMKVRLFDRLAEWITMDDTELLNEIEDLTGFKIIQESIKRSYLSRARQLFAQVLESQASLRVSTIHSLCETILRHFSLETRVPFDFQIIDEIKKKDIIEQVIIELAEEKNPHFLSFNSIMAPGSESMLTELVLDILSNKARVTGDDFLKYFGEEKLNSVESFSNMGDRYQLRGRISDEILSFVANAFLSGGEKTKEYGNIIAKFRELDGEIYFNQIEKIFLTAENRPRDARRFPEKKVKEKYPEIAAYIEAITNEIMAIQNQSKVLDLYLKTKELKKFSSLLILRFERVKSQKNVLDYNDLLEKTLHLLSKNGMVSWVNYKIDSSIEHLLVDESQDISPIQWKIINIIAEEFFNDQDTNIDPKSIFVVGDDKQSIYSFQGAVPSTFSSVNSLYSEKLLQAGSKLNHMELTDSFRSSALILNFVNEVFRDPAWLGVKEFSIHKAQKNLPGKIEIWQSCEKQKCLDVSQRWWDRFFITNNIGNEGSSAEELVEEISQILVDGVIPNEGGSEEIFRNVEPRDILILFRSRGTLFYETIQELKRYPLPVNGADRLILTEDIAIKDLLSLLKFLDNSLDDLSLAEALKSPIFNLDDNDLFKASYNREKSLWENCLTSIPQHEAIKEIKYLFSEVDELTIYQTLELILTELEGMERFIARLGPEVEEIINEFVDFALDYEQTNISSIYSFINWISKNKLEVKRQAGNEGNHIRVMTVHGSKGKEAPVVILADTKKHSFNNMNSKIVKSESSFFFKQDKRERPQEILKIEQINNEESQLEENRLLYVALTRCQYWLIIFGKDEKKTESWYEKCLKAYQKMPHNGQKCSDGISFKKLVAELSWYDGSQKIVEPHSDYPSSSLGELNFQPLALRKQEKKRLTPSKLLSIANKHSKKEVEKSERSSSEISLDLGKFIHILLDNLTRVDVTKRKKTALNIANLSFSHLSSGSIKSAVNEVTSLMQHQELKRFFTVKARFETSISGNLEGFGRISGKIDYMLISPKMVEVLDFKTDMNPPLCETEVKPNQIVQLALYTAFIQQIYPKHCIITYILWTKSKLLMPISKNLQEISLGTFRNH